VEGGRAQNQDDIHLQERECVHAASQRRQSATGIRPKADQASAGAPGILRARSRGSRRVMLEIEVF
jgi:hypothetical protein